MQQQQERKPVRRKRKASEVVWANGWLPRHVDMIKDATGLTVLDPKGGLGCGYFGCVYQTDDPRWVVKVTRDKTEAVLAELIRKFRASRDGGDGTGPSAVLPGIIFFKNVIRAHSIYAVIRKMGRTFCPYVIVRENVQPMTDEDVGKMRWCQEPEVEDAPNLKDYPKPCLDVLMSWAERYYRRAHSEEGMTEAIVRYGMWMDILRPEFPLVIDAMQTLFDEEDILLQDVHAKNVSFSLVDWGTQYRPPGTVVIHDLGATPTGNQDVRFKLLNPIGVERTE
jgi:hypothetical protein